MYGSGNSDKQSLIICCLIFSVVWIFCGVILICVGVLASTSVVSSSNDLYNCKIAGIIVLPFSIVWCYGMLFWMIKDTSEFKRTQEEHFEKVNRELAAADQNVSSSTPIVNQGILIQPPPAQQVVITTVTVTNCRSCGTPRQYGHQICMRCGASDAAAPAFPPAFDEAVLPNNPYGVR